MKRAKMCMVILLQFLLFLLSCSKEKVSVSSPSAMTVTNTNIVGEVFGNRVWQMNWPPGTGLWCLERTGGDIFIRHPYPLNSQYGSDYYTNHVRVYIKPSDSDLWQAVPYVQQDQNGVNNNDVYFTDDNYVVSFPGLGTIIAPRILIIAKPSASIDFSKTFDVKIVFV